MSESEKPVSDAAGAGKERGCEKCGWTGKRVAGIYLMNCDYCNDRRNPSKPPQPPAPPTTGERAMDPVVDAVALAYQRGHDDTVDGRWSLDTETVANEIVKEFSLPLATKAELEQQLAAANIKIKELEEKRIEINRIGSQLLEPLGKFITSTVESGHPLTTTLVCKFDDIEHTMLYLWATTDDKEPVARIREIAASKLVAVARADKAESDLADLRRDYEELKASIGI